MNTHMTHEKVYLDGIEVPQVIHNKYDLEPCPFCHGEASLSQGRMGLPPIIGHYVECINCAGSCDMFETVGKAVEAWNSRLKESAIYWNGFDDCLEMIDNQLLNYESNELATMNCWELIEKIREDMIDNAELYKKDE